MQNQTRHSSQDSNAGTSSRSPVTVPSDVKQYEAPIKRMENEAGYREWLDREKLVVPAGEMNKAQHRDHRVRADQDANITHEINDMLQVSKVNVTELNVSVSDCDVVVSGCVEDRKTMEQIVAICERAKGVDTVINDLKIYDHDHPPLDACIRTNTQIETHTHSKLDPKVNQTETNKTEEVGLIASTTKLLSAAFEALQR